MTTTYGAGDPRTSLAGLWRYDYDDTGQLIGWTAPWGRHVDYTYDALGNRINVCDDGTNTAYTVNNLNQYIQVGNTMYQYDADGNLTNKVTSEGATIFGWSSDKKLIRMSERNGFLENKYAANGDRTASNQEDGVREHIIDPLGLGNEVIVYMQGVDHPAARFDHGDGLVSHGDIHGITAFYSFDALGNTSEIIGENSDLVNLYSYLPFGNLVYMSRLLSADLEFAGQHGVKTERPNAVYMRARYFDPDVGRFITEDPAGFSGGSPNLYSYTRNAPTMGVDPSGLHMEFPPGIPAHTHCYGRRPVTDYNPAWRNNPFYPFACTVIHEGVHRTQCEAGAWPPKSSVDCLEAAAYAASAQCSGQRWEKNKADEYARKCRGEPTPAPRTPIPSLKNGRQCPATSSPNWS